MAPKCVCYTALSAVIFSICVGQLVVNVKNQGEVLKETIMSNVSDDSVTLLYPQTDGTLITQLIDFKQDVQIFKIIVLGEEELGQNQYQVICFVTRFARGDFISSDAMSKLRQKNPGTVRTPEEDRGTEDIELDVSLDVQGSKMLSSHIPVLCSEAAQSTYAREHEIKIWMNQRRDGGDLTSITSSMSHLPTRGVVRCLDSGRELATPCSCHLQVCIPWYPCGLKYCKGRDNSGKAVSYRCGIKTCRKCRNFDYFVQQHQLCLWED
ncbi:BRICHOS-like domain-containing protein out at first [Oratosquilla oratoria]|uniref:BRICHOS-like domain-containing protein out at first n=1 Tax=Oratosquilla oratoria TaxID=337810 RepID=UPI003F7629C0